MIRRAIAGIRYLFRKDRIEREMDAEIRYHLDRQMEEMVRRGMTPVQARAAARHVVGGIEQVKEECRQARAGRVLEETLTDVRHGLRVLAKSPASP